MGLLTPFVAALRCGHVTFESKRGSGDLEAAYFHAVMGNLPVRAMTGTLEPFTVRGARTTVVLEQHLGEG